MGTEISFVAVGDPAPQGSKTAIARGGRAVVVDGASTNARHKHARWRACVAEAAMAARGETTFDGPVSVSIRFYLALPKADRYRTRHVVAPDSDKLARAVLDSLTNSGLIRDDSLVCDLHVVKRYARGAQFVGAYVSVTDLTDEEATDRQVLKAAAAAMRRA